MPRPVSATSRKDAVVCARFTAQELAVIDARRRGLSRAAYVRGMVLKGEAERIPPRK